MILDKYAEARETELEKKVAEKQQNRQPEAKKEPAMAIR
jgi:hypothetical protein